MNRETTEGVLDIITLITSEQCPKCDNFKAILDRLDIQYKTRDRLLNHYRLWYGK